MNNKQKCYFDKDIDYDLWIPTTAYPGSREKIEVMIYRAANGLPVFHPLDSNMMNAKDTNTCNVISNSTSNSISNASSSETPYDVEEDDYYAPGKIRRRMRSTGHEGRHKYRRKAKGKGKGDGKGKGKCKDKGPIQLSKLPDVECLLAS
jgi:hypothetical protein